MRTKERRSDAALLHAARGTDPEAYARHVDAVLAYFGRRVADREAVADLTAECFAAALRSVGRWDPARGEPAAWLFGIAAHQLSHLRRRGAVERRARERLGIERVALSGRRAARGAGRDRRAARRAPRRAAHGGGGARSRRPRLRRQLVVLPGDDAAERSGGTDPAAGDEAALARQAQLLCALRRPPTPADRGEVADPALRAVRPAYGPREAGVRLLRTDPDGRPYVLVPVKRFSALRFDRRTGAPRTTVVRDAFCLVIRTVDGSSPRCWDADAIRGGRAFGSVSTRTYGLAPDGVAYVRARTGGRFVPVHDNFYAFERTPQDFAPPRWFAADGRRIAPARTRGHDGPDAMGIDQRVAALRMPTGASTTLARLIGEAPAVVTFTASWCAPCADDTDALRQLEASGLPVIAVAQNDTAAGAAEVARRLGDGIPVGRSTTPDLAGLLGARGVPVTLVVDPFGGTLARRAGRLRPGDAERFRAAVAAW